jgi:hypothetical protein
LKPKDREAIANEKLQAEIAQRASLAQPIPPQTIDTSGSEETLESKVSPPAQTPNLSGLSTLKQKLAERQQVIDEASNAPIEQTQRTNVYNPTAEEKASIEPFSQPPPIDKDKQVNQLSSILAGRIAARTPSEQKVLADFRGPGYAQQLEQSIADYTPTSMEGNRPNRAYAHTALRNLMRDKTVNPMAKIGLGALNILAPSLGIPLAGRIGQSMAKRAESNLKEHQRAQGLESTIPQQHVQEAKSKVNTAKKIGEAQGGVQPLEPLGNPTQSIVGTPTQNFMRSSIRKR